MLLDQEYTRERYMMQNLKICAGKVESADQNESKRFQNAVKIHSEISS